ncbi:MAG: Glutamate-tRNA ligase [Parcubacteria group bacterium GW2011_GWA2_40_8]|nr:MAG: Glutamate-tRNA ligase [Parcubacteria group bacterium GW2011_GWA2_40_8]
MTAKTNNIRLLVTGGGTGGHIFPIIAVTTEFKKLIPVAEPEIYFLGPANFGIDNLTQSGIKTVIIPAGKIPRYPTVAIFSEILKIIASLFLGALQMWRLMPDIVFSKGGFGGFSSVFAAWLFRIPVIIHESDAVPGLANRLCARFAKKIILSFPDENNIFPKNKTILAGNPVRSELLEASTKTVSANPSQRKILVVLGGSQGSQEINTTVLDILPELLHDMEVVHQCGENNFRDLSFESKIVLEKEPELEKYYHLRPFLKIEDLATVLEKADLIISRSGAGSIFEIAAMGKASILIPLESSAGGHQLKNAEIYTKTGAGIMLIGANAKSHLLYENIMTLLNDPERLKLMQEAAKKFATPNAAKVIAEEIIDTAGIKMTAEIPIKKNKVEPVKIEKQPVIKKKPEKIKQINIVKVKPEEHRQPEIQRFTALPASNGVRVRYAPSPTGMMHVGNFRTALYNYLFARKNNGVFYVRIEDTDQTRYVEGGMESILETLQVMGIKHDEGPFLQNKGIVQSGDFGPYIQSQRIDLYRSHANDLVTKGLAYLCFCTEERLSKVREEQKKNKVPTGYDRLCRSFSETDVIRKQQEETPFVIRFKMPDTGETRFNDVIRGDISFRNDLMDDYILLKSDGFPTYHLANIVDDHLMQTTHVIRGEEWLSSTPKHVLLYRAFAWQEPQFIHLPLLLNTDRSKLSKRQGDVTVEEYLRLGYFPEAIINFVALLGWNPGTEQEIFSLEDLVKEFSFERINKSGAVFDIAKLNWLNKYYINNSDKRWSTVKDPLVEKIKKTLELRNIVVKDTDLTVSAIEQRLTGPNELIKILDTEFIFLPQKNSDGSVKKLNYPKELLIWKKMSDEEELKISLDEIFKILSDIPEGVWASQVEQILLTEAANKGDRGMLLWPLRVALSGQKVSPGPADIAKILGKEETLERVKDAIDKI